MLLVGLAVGVAGLRLIEFSRLPLWQGLAGLVLLGIADMAMDPGIEAIKAWIKAVLV